MDTHEVTPPVLPCSLGLALAPRSFRAPACRAFPDHPITSGGALPSYHPSVLTRRALQRQLQGWRHALGRAQGRAAAGGLGAPARRGASLG